MPSSELIFQPQIDEADLRRTQKKTEDAFKRASEQIGRDLRNEVDGGIESGARSGTRKAQHHLKLAAVSIAAAAGAVIIDSLDKTLSGADEVAQRFEERLNRIGEVAGTGEAFGIETGRMAALTASFMAKGIDPDDLRGLMTGFQAELIDAPEMAGYKDLAGEEGFEIAFLTFLRTVSGMDQSQRMDYLLPVFGEEDAVLAAKFTESLAQMGAKGEEFTFKNIVETTLGESVDLQALSESGVAAAEQRAEMARFEAQKFLEGFKPLTDSQVQAMKDLAESNRRLEKSHEAAFELKVKTTITANDLEVQQINATKAVVSESINYLGEMGERTENLIEAGNQPIGEMETWANFGKALFEWGTYSPLESATDKSLFEHIADFIDRRGGEMSQLAQDATHKKIMESDKLAGPKK